MKVLMLNGSPRKTGCTYTALEEIGKTLSAEGVESEIVWLGSGPLYDCMACNKCSELGKCVITDDAVESFAAKCPTADGFIFGTPVYYAHPNGRILSALDRLFYSAGESLAHKPGAAIASARRAGTVASVDALNKYFTINQMPVVSSTYWNVVHGACAADVQKDLEGLQTMRNLARNMAWMLKCIDAGARQGIVPPAAESGMVTNFIR